MRRKQHLLRRPRTKIGAPPGTLIHVGERKVASTRLRLLDYHADGCEERDLQQIEPELAKRDSSRVTWLNIDGLHDPGIIEEVGRCFALHPLVQEDLLNTQQRPKLEDYGEYLFLVLKMLRIDPTGEVHTEQLSLILGPSFVLSFQELEGDVFEQVRERIRGSKGRIRRMGPDYLAYALLDAVVDSYFLVLEE
ncbi:MAG: magnesium and cobalt transport protein CorA, partial [Desulfuromonadales bacterium]|nr:magnesium and cobalt transport protein CorA [Desulfuromonadales bacterium]